MERMNSEASARYEKHMEREETAFGKLYDRLKRLEEAIVEAFKERDEKLHILDKAQVRLLAYATAAFAVITVVADFAVGSLA